MQALFTMHELLVAIDKPEIVKNIFIDVDPKISKSPKDLVIKIKHDVNIETLKVIEPIIQKRNLKIEKMEEMLVIH